MVELTSKANPIVHHASELKDKKYVRQYGECLVESEKIVNELVDKGKATTLLVDSTKADKYAYITDKCDGSVHYISPKIAEYLADTATTSGIFAIVKVSFVSTDIVSGNAVVLDNLQDPSNLGAIIRSARAFGFNDIFLINSVFPYTLKTIRASMGYVFDVQMHDITYEGLRRMMNENDISLVVADMDGVPVNDFQPNGKVALVIGNEGNGISDEIKDMHLQTISIPMKNNVESLNASISASILMHYISNKGE